MYTQYSPEQLQHIRILIYWQVILRCYNNLSNESLKFCHTLFNILLLSQKSWYIIWNRWDSILHHFHTHLLFYYRRFYLPISDFEGWTSRTTREITTSCTTLWIEKKVFTELFYIDLYTGVSKLSSSRNILGRLN